MKQQLEAIIFDFDGVLVDSNHIKNEAFRQLFSSYGDAVVAEVLRYHRFHGGISRIEKIRYTYENIINSPLRNEELSTLAQKYADLVTDKVITAPWIPGARETLEHLFPLLPLFLISGTPEEELRTIIHHRDMAHFFTEILGSPTFKPAHIENVCQRYRLEPTNCLFIGDARTDHQAASLFNIPFLGIQGDYQFPEDVLVFPDCTSLPAHIVSQFELTSYPPKRPGKR